MTPAQRTRYEQAYYKLLGELTALDAMVHEYPEPADVIEPALAFDLEDLARRINALTAVWAAT